MSTPTTIEEAIGRIQLASLNLQTRQELIVHEGNRKAIEQVARWLYNSPRYEGDRRKGIELRGPKGTGKTHLMRCLSAMLFPDGFLVKKCADIVTEFSDTSVVKVGGETRPIGGYQVIDKYAAMPRVCFDDLLEEPMGKWYGEEVNVMQMILSKRGDLMASQRMLTMITTNHGSDEEEARYGQRVRDRLALMRCPFVVHPNPDPNATGLRETAEVLDWRKPTETPVNERVSIDRVQQVIQQLADEKNDGLKERLREEQEGKSRYLAGFIGRARQMTLTELMHAVKWEPYSEARKIARQEFDRRAPISLEELEKQAQERLAEKAKIGA